MARRRYLSTEISVDPRVADLASAAGPYAALLYTWLIPHADDQGIVAGNPRQIKLQVVPGLEQLGSDEIEAALAAMRELGLIEWDGAVLRFPQSFYKHQSYIKDERRRSAQNAANLGNAAIPAQNAASSSSPVSSSSSSSKDENLEEESPPPSAAVAAMQRQRPIPVPLVKLSDGARTLLDHWRMAHGKRSPPKLNPTEAAKLEDALADLGLDRLTEAVTYMAGRGVEPLAKAISAANTKRLNDEQGRSNGHGENRQPSGGLGARSRSADAGARAGGAGDDDPFAKYVQRYDGPE